MNSRIARALIRWAFQQLYTRFAFAYDAVSACVSRGEWQTWTRAAIPFLRGGRVLEVAFGTGNLHLELRRAGWALVGVDLSPQMLAIAQRKFRRYGLEAQLVRADAQQLPFADARFSTVLMTFPPGFLLQERAQHELRRVLEADGTLVWVDAPWLYPCDVWSRLLNLAFRLTGGCFESSLDETVRRLKAAEGTGEHRWKWQAHAVECAHSRIHVFVATKRE